MSKIQTSRARPHAERGFSFPSTEDEEIEAALKNAAFFVSTLVLKGLHFNGLTIPRSLIFLSVVSLDSYSLIARAKSLELDTPYVPPPGDPLLHHAAGFAEVMCSAVFIRYTCAVWWVVAAIISLLVVLRSTSNL